MENSDTERRQKQIQAKLKNLTLTKEEKQRLAVEIDLLATILIDMYRHRKISI
jgi:hypothetical protein